MKLNDKEKNILTNGVYVRYKSTILKCFNIENEKCYFSMYEMLKERDK